MAVFLLVFGEGTVWWNVPGLPPWLLALGLVSGKLLLFCQAKREVGALLFLKADQSNEIRWRGRRRWFD